MNITIYVTSNINGKVFEKRVLDVVHDLGIQAEVVSINESPSNSIEEVFFTPVLYVNDQVVSSGKVLSKEEISQFFV